MTALDDLELLGAGADGPTHYGPLFVVSRPT